MGVTDPCPVPEPPRANTSIAVGFEGKAVTVNGMPVTLPKSYSGSGLLLENIGLFVSLSSRLGITLLWDGGMRVYVRLEPHLRGRVGGLCGNFDGDSENDFTTRQGIVESTPELFGNSWKVSPSCPDVSEQDLRDPCNINPHRVSWAKKKCAVITQELFSPCHAEVPHQQYYDWCVFDACGCDSGGDCECLCTAIAAYAEECNRRGVYIRWRSQELCRDSCISPSECPCEWEGSLFPPGAAVTQHCQNCSCSNSTWHCTGPACPPTAPCLESEFQCSGGSHRCIPSLWLCDNEDDCGDGSDELCPTTCAPEQFRCSGGACLPLELRCNGHPDCADQSDEEFCAPVTAVPGCVPEEFRCVNGRCLSAAKVCDGRLDCGFADDSDERDCGVVCAEEEFRCSAGRCILYLHRCDGHDDCGDFSDERGCVCAPGEFQCPGDQCMPSERVCDGHKDCPSGIDEVICPVKDCNQYEFGCANGQCVPLAWRCDGETDCLDESDEQQCARACGPDQVPCQSGDQCVQHLHLCDGTPHCRDASDESVDNCGSTRIPPCPDSFSCDNRTCVNTSRVCDGIPDCPRGEDELLCEKPSISPLLPGGSNKTHTCPEFTCLDGSCVPFKSVCNGVADCPDSGSPSDEQGCQSWGPWGPWSPCSRSCGSGIMSRYRHCPVGDMLTHCRGDDTQRQQCYSTACPEPCPQDGCANLSCPVGLVSHACAPCPLTCAHISSNTSCDPSAQCFTGCWCPEGKVMNHMQQCVLPEECVCEVSGVRYWPGQQVKKGCEICRCERGRPQHCRANPECSVHCGWSSWSPWGECLGPCGVQSVQWSFRSPNNPSKHGNGRQCRGIYRKARRCQTAPCEECEYQGQTHVVGDHWKGSNCHLCHCLPNLKVQCAPFCPYATTGCPQGQTLIPGKDNRCCYCEDKDQNVSIITTTPAVLPITVESSRTPEVTPLVPTFPLPPGDECWSPLGVQSLPTSSFSASSQQSGHPASAGRLHFHDPRSDLQGWSPEPEEYRELPPSAPHAHTHHSQAPYLQIDLLRPYNITGLLTQGGGQFDTFVSSFYLQFSTNGSQWFTYKELITDARPNAKVFLGNHDDRSVMQNRLDRMVLARFVRVLPHDFQNGIYLRVELMGCGDEYEWLSTPAPTVSLRPCSEMEFQCGNGRCVPTGPQGVLCDGVNDCGDGSDELNCGSPPSPTPSSKGCPRGTCSSPLGLEDGRVHYGQLTASSYRQNNPADTGRLNIVPNVLVMEPGWSPLPGDPQPYFQVDFLDPTWISGIITQGSERMWGYLSKYRLAFALSENHFMNFTESEDKGSAPKIFEVRMVGRTPVTRWLGRLVRARYLRIIPVQYRHTFYLRVEILGCRGDTVPTTGLPGIWNHTVTPGSPGYQNHTSGFPGVHTKSPQDGSPGVPQGPTGQPGSSTLPPITPTRRPLVPSPCSAKQFTCGSGECVRLEKKCDLHKDCADGSDERNCVDCVMSLWTAWSQCSVSCGLGSLFRQRKILRDARPGGSCGGAQFDSRACFLQACPVDGQWAEWGEWSECDAECGGGVKIRSRSCSNPPPKNGGQECEGMTMQTQSCNTHQCGTGTGPQTGCTSGLVLVTDADCAAGRVEPCPLTCLDLNSESNCSSHCMTGCRCPVGLFRQDGRCVNVSKCACSWEGMCRDGHVSCDNSSCIPKCDWSVLSPPEAVNVEPCVGDSTEARQCYTPCPPDVCPIGMSHLTKEQCQEQGGACPRVCLDAMTSVECATECYDGCYCSSGYYMFNNSCVLLSHCPCYHQGVLYPQGASVQHDPCNNCTCINGEMQCGTAPCPVDCGWSEWTFWSACSRTCDVGIRRRYRSGTNPPQAFGGLPCVGDRAELDTCSIYPCSGVKDPWSAWSECSVPCGGGYRSRTRGPIRSHGTPQQFSACNLHPCSDGSGCAGGQEWTACVREALLCSDLGIDTNINSTCSPGCQCPQGSALQDGRCVPLPLCRCDVDGEQYEPGAVLKKDCNNCTCESGRLRNCTQVKCNVDGGWSDWTPWSACSVSCGAGLQSRYRFCSNPERAGAGLPCLGPDRQDQVCVQTACSRNGGWSEWTSWTECTKSCGGGLRSRRRECANPATEGDGDFCEGLKTELVACNAERCPVPQCSDISGAVFSSCGPSCPRTCDELAHCAWHCEPGCYCIDDKVLNVNGTACVEREQCPCLDLTTGQRIDPGETVLTSDGCNNCTCDGGQLTCSNNPCPVHGSWGLWSEWSECDACVGVSVRKRECNSPPARFGGLPCHGESLQSRGCHDNQTVCSDSGMWYDWSAWSMCSVTCGGGEQRRTRSCRTPPCTGLTRQSKTCNTQVCLEVGCPPGRLYRECERGEGCPFSCAQLSGLEGCYSDGCEEGCHCPPNTYQHHGACLQECPCLVDNELLSSLQKVSMMPELTPDLYNITMGTELRSGEELMHECSSCLCEHGLWNCSLVPCPQDGGLSPWGPWSPCSLSCGGLGQKVRSRSCTNPSPAHGGQVCVGDLQETAYCQTPDCPVDGSWSRWSPWSHCDKSCGGGRSIRTRSCSSPPPKNGGLKCLGEKNQVKPCNTKPCDERGCPLGQEFVPCANECPQSCSDLQQDIQCQDNTECQPGCRCPQGELQQDGVCVKLWQCDCIDALGQSWSAGSQHQVDCHNCSCADGILTCTNLTCPGKSHCSWSLWSSWASCSVTCGAGQRARFRSLIPETPDADCQFEEVQHKPCDPGPCPPLCLHGNQSLSVGDTWLEDDLCPWSSWSPCSRSCGAGVVSRRRHCLCEEAGDHTCPISIETDKHREETRLCYKRPCPDCPMSEWSEWTVCSCVSQWQQRYRVPLSLATAGQHCSEIEKQSRACKPQDCQECMEPFQPDCGSPCEKQCVLQGQVDACTGQSGCTDGCYCPQGLLHQNGTCVPPEHCGCVHLMQQDTDSPVPVTVPQGGVLNIGCSTCLCHNGSLQCDSRECEVSLSEWSEWTPCSPCVPASSLLHSDSSMDDVGVISDGLGMPETALVSVQKRFRTCLDLDSGLPVSERKGECAKPLQEERICPQPDVCKGERCEDRGRVYEDSCANQCPRSCADLWEHVQCLQGVCHPGPGVCESVSMSLWASYRERHTGDYTWTECHSGVQHLCVREWVTGVYGPALPIVRGMEFLE
ncbi:hypothetical protein QTP70_011460 [Hemibagrus guttatus]|uniref:SCO-spondin n=1 Tax=Hemibagrus guttatus TaxID=175788 RepID=A0AAE0RBV6_9TELE|nr:hypothetical protein QTP70_011460 [Hemibagrus guttatus]